ncbi:DUF6431 domain-containing protein [Caloramator mitchellensis]|uniref:DUF6431 domain-containing protein n=1 Tax=Caloramator mitchellensis TaxID=908809 RepID=UPI0009F8F649|nr:DUF6431 domain-containing protein [Caloramator mitchellensis]
MIISKFSNFIHQYLFSGEASFYPTQYGCKNCGYMGKLHRHGYYYRNVITVFGTYKIKVLRVKCPSCKKTHALLPHFLVPYFQYSFYTILFLLFLNFVLGFSYSEVLSKIEKYKSLCSLNPSSLSRFHKRFISKCSEIKFFFANFTDIYPEFDLNKSGVLIKYIISYERRNISFNTSYFDSMPSYFFSS